MNFLILGDGPEERAWAVALAETLGHRLIAAYPGVESPAGVHAPSDLDDALAVPGVEAVVVGGDFQARAEALRRAAAEGLAIVVIHPPGEDSEAYYQVALSREETGATVVPDLPARLHPVLLRLGEALRTGELGAFRDLRYEATVEPSDGVPERDLVRVVFARAVDVVRSLLGEIEAVNASGNPPGVRPDLGLVAQLRVAGGRRAEVRLSTGTPGPISITLQGANGTLKGEIPPDLAGPSRILGQGVTGGESVESFLPWNPGAATLRVLESARENRPARPNLQDATRATEVAEGVVRSLRRGRTIDLNYEDISEEATFKGVMTSIGCMVLLAILVVIPLALAGPALGIGGTIYLAYAIPPILLGFLFLQLLRFAARKPKPGPDLPE